MAARKRKRPTGHKRGCACPICSRGKRRGAKAKRSKKKRATKKRATKGAKRESALVTIRCGRVYRLVPQ